MVGYFDEESHCEEQSDEAIFIKQRDCFDKERLAMTAHSK